MKIELLADHPQLAEQVGRWHLKAWPEEYPKHGLSIAVDDARQTSRRNSLPLSLIALENGLAVGTISLVEKDLRGRENLSPWLTSLYVEPKFRFRGLARRLVEAGLDHASRLHISALYLWVVKNARVYERWGWRLVEHAHFAGQQVWILKGDVERLAPRQTTQQRGRKTRKPD